jgi:hypothetical protein
MQMRVFIDQYKGIHYAMSVKDLQRKLGGACHRMYIDRQGKSFHVGYVVGKLWCTEFIVRER